MSTRRLLPLVILGLTLLCTTLALGAERTRKTGARSPAAQPRTFTDASGNYKVRATLVGVEEGMVRLRRSDGSVIRVSLEKLSEEDQAWIQKQITAASQAPAALEGEWPSFRGPNRDGKSPDTGLLKEWPSGGPKLLWKTDILGKGYSSAAVAAGLVYITGDAGDTLQIYAFDMGGNPKWRVPHGPAWTASHPGSRATPTIDGGNLYLLSGTGLAGCFDAKTGKGKWARNVREFGGSPGGWGYAESVLILGNLAIFKPGGRNCIVAVDKQTGRDVWASQGFATGPEYSSCLPFTYGNVPMIVTGTRGGIVCVNARNGALLWGNDFAANNTANCPTPAYSDGHVFWANGYGKGGICLKLGPGGTASEAWRTRDMECHHGGYIIEDGHIYGNNGGGYACLDLKSGQRKWSERAVGKGSLCWADNMLYLFGESGGQAALATCSPEGLEIKGRLKVEGEGPSWAHPVVIGGRLYLRYDTNLYCFDVKGQ